jgi:hypothetical protein
MIRSVFFVFLVIGFLAASGASIRVNVAWDESDYQIDVGTPDGVAEYGHEIFDERCNPYSHMNVSGISASSTAMLAWA